MATTTNYLFELPTVGGDDAVWGGSLNQNWTDLDADLTTIQTDIDSRVLTSGIGSAVQAWDAQLDDIAALAPTDSNFIVGDGANWVLETPTVARASLEIARGKEFIRSVDASASSEITFTSADFDEAKYDFYTWEFANIEPTTDASVLRMQTSTTGDTPWDAGASDYFSSIYFGDAAEIVNNTLTYMKVGGEVAVGTAAGEDGLSGTLKCYGPHLVKATMFRGDFVCINQVTVIVQWDFAGARSAAENLDAVRFWFELAATGADTIAAGTISMFGHRNGI